MKVTIIGINNNSGLEKDKNILTGLLRNNGIDVDFRDIHDFKPISADTDLCIHLEIVDERCFGKRNILIPNQEWFMTEWLKYLDRFEAIFCKSKYAYDIFTQYHGRVNYTGFTSVDCYLPGDKIKSCFHASGKSKAKGTSFLTASLKEYEGIDIHIASKHIDPCLLRMPNVFVYNYLADEEYNRLRNQALIHIYPSQIEGFGHCINEAMSCGAVVLTTDYPPMNELGCNFLIPFEKEYALPDRLGGIVFLSPSAIRETLDEVLKQDDLFELGAQSRTRFLKNDILFRQRFMEALHNL